MTRVLRAARIVKMRAAIAASLWIGGLLFVVLIVSAVLWLGMSSLGDHAGAQGAKGVALVALVCSVLNLITLVVLLAVAQLTTLEATEEDEEA